MAKLFNIAGSCNPRSHYILPAAARLPELQRLVDDKQYFLIHAPRQSGKTTCIQQFAQQLNGGGKYYALYCSLETLREVTDPDAGIRSVLSALKTVLRFSNCPEPHRFGESVGRDTEHTSALHLALADYCRLMDRPLVILFDEADGLYPSVLIPIITQLRNGYISRNSGVPFPHSVALAGLRDIRDYRRFIRPDDQSLGGLSPFNIITKAMTLQNFTADEVTALYAQHTAETGQVFETEAIKHVHEQTQGQPWLVNAVAREVIDELLDRDYAPPITLDLVHEAIQRLIKNRPVHLDNLIERLKEPRVRNIIQPLLLGDEIPDRNNDDFQYTRDLGLIRQTDTGEVLPANPIYAEMIIRALTAPTQSYMAQSQTPYAMPKYILPDGGIDMDLLLSDFIVFWREHNPAWRDKNGEYGIYSEASLVILLCAFLNRLVNGGGEVNREMSAGRGRMDIGVVYKGRKYPIEVKVRRERDSLDTVEAQGREQLRRYMERLSAPRGWLLVHDRPAASLTVLPHPLRGLY
jgi:hypothetical protein